MPVDHINMAECLLWTEIFASTFVVFDGNSIKLLSVSLQYVNAPAAGNTAKVAPLERNQFLEGSAHFTLFLLSDLFIRSPQLYFDGLCRTDKYFFSQGQTHSKEYADVGLIFMTKNVGLLP